MASTWAVPLFLSRYTEQLGQQLWLKMESLRNKSIESRSLPSGIDVQKPLFLAAASACTTSSSEMGTAASQRQASQRKQLKNIDV